MRTQEQSLTLSKVEIKRDDRLFHAKFPCQPDVEGGCALNSRRKLGEFLGPKFIGPGETTPHISYGGFVCGLPDKRLKDIATAPRGCHSGPDEYPALAVNVQRLDETVQVVINDDGSTSFTFI